MKFNWKSWTGLGLVVVGMGIIACGGENKNQAAETNTQTENTTSTTTKDVETKTNKTADVTSKEVDYASLGMLVDGNAPQGLQVGDDAPHILVRDYNGNEIDSEKILAQVPMVLIFYRGKWCPLCEQYLSEFNDSLRLIQDEGAIVLTVTPETPDNAREMRELTNMSMNIIPDSAQLLMNAFDVSFDVTEAYQEKIRSNFSVDIAENNGAESAQLPVPATFIINKSGKIAWRHFDPDYRNRASVKDILAHLWD